MTTKMTRRAFASMALAAPLVIRSGTRLSAQTLREINYITPYGNSTVSHVRMNEDGFDSIELKDFLVQTHIGERSARQRNLVQPGFFDRGFDDPTQGIFQGLLSAIRDLFDRIAFECF